MPPLRTMTPVNRMGHISWSGARLWSPAQLTALAAWYEASPVYCYQDGAAQFTAASSQYLSRANNIAPGSASFSLAGWVKITALTGAIQQIFQQSAGAANGWQITAMASGELYFQSWTSGGVADSIIGPTLSTGQWYFIAVTYNVLTGAKRLTVDETVYTSTVASIGDGGALLTLGAWNNGGSQAYYFNGVMDSFGVWNRVLSTDEIASLYNSGTGKTYADLTTAEKVNLLSFWNLNEDSGTRNDSHGTNHLTDNNSVGLAAGIARGQCSDGDPIALLQDRSGNGYHLTQTDPLKRPTLRLVSGKWVSLFDGINDTMESAYTQSGSFTMCMGVNLLDPGNYPMVFVLYDSQAELRSESTQGKYSINGTTSLGAYIVNDDLSLIGIMNAITGARAVYVDGAEYGTATMAAGAIPANTIRLGTRDGTLYPANMRAGTVVLTTSVIDSNTIAKMSNYIANRLP